MSQSDGERELFLAGEAHFCDLCESPFDDLDDLANHDCAVTDGGQDIEEGTPAARIREARVQLTLALEDVDNPDAERFARGALGQAESASVCLEGVQDVGGLDELMITRDTSAGTAVIGPRPDVFEEEAGWR
jgi:hypothetical protein